MKIWIDILNRYKKPFISAFSPGFDNTYDYRVTSKLPKIYRDIKGFEIYSREVKKLPNPLDTFFLSSFNDWFEGHQIEPTIGYGYSYLDILKKELQDDAVAEVSHQAGIATKVARLVPIGVTKG
jgi:hypothetical protein